MNQDLSMAARSEFVSVRALLLSHVQQCVLKDAGEVYVVSLSVGIQPGGDRNVLSN